MSKDEGEEKDEAGGGEASPEAKTDEDAPKPEARADEGSKAEPPAANDDASAAAAPSETAREDDDEDAAPLSMRDVELEPVSLNELKKILAPGKPPPARLSDRPPPLPDAPRADASALPRKRLPSAPKRPAPTAKTDTEDLASDSGLLDLKQLAAQAPAKGRRGSIPDDELANLSALAGTTQAAPLPLTPPDLSPPIARDAPEPAPPKAPAKKKTTGDDARAAGGAPTRAASTRPAAKAAASARPPSAAKESEEGGAGRWVWIAFGAAALFAAGVIVGRATSDSQSPTTASSTSNAASSNVTAAGLCTAAASQAATEPRVTVASSAPSDQPLEDASASASAIVASASAAAKTAKVAASGAPATPSAKPSATAVAGGGDFDRDAANAALQSAVGAASGCKQPGDPSGVAHITITFAPSGRVTSANLSGPPFQGTQTGSCIARSMRSASVPPFTGDPVTVTKTVTIP